MAIQSVTSSISAYTSSTQGSQAQQAQQAEKPEPRPEQQVEPKDEAPRPVVNAQGQQTGTTISVIA